MVSVTSATWTPRQDRILGMCSTREGTSSTHGGGPRRQGSLAGTRQRCAPGTSAQGAAGRLIGPAGHRRRERDTDSRGRSSLVSTADGSSDLAIIMPDKPPTCCLCPEKANSIFPMVTWAWGLTGRGPITTKCIKMVELLPRGPLGLVACPLNIKH